MKPAFKWDYIGLGAYLRFNYRGIGSVTPTSLGDWQYKVTWQGMDEVGRAPDRESAVRWVEAWADRQTGLPYLPVRKSTKGRWKFK